MTAVIPTTHDREVSSKAGRNTETPYWPNLDLLRVVAIAAVILIHSAETATLKAFVPWCRFAVPTFTAASILLLLARHGADSGQGLFEYVSKRCFRIYGLFLVWNFLYAGARVLEHRFVHGHDPIRWNLETIFLAGFAEHLWFLPFLVAATVLVAPLGYWAFHLPSRSAVTALEMLVATAGIALASLPAPVNVDLINHPATYWAVLSWEALPSALLVLALIPWVRGNPLSFQFSTIATIPLVMGIGALWLSTRAFYPVLCQNAAGVCLALAAVTLLPAKSFSRIFRKLGSLALPTYLLHVLVVHGIQAVGHHVFHLPASVIFDLALFLCTLLGSAILALVLLRVPMAKRLFAI